MKKANTNNREILDQYFAGLLDAKTKAPFIDGVKEATGVSLATISRYARKQGFYSYSDMRINYTKKIEAFTGVHGDINKLINFLQNDKKFVIITSLSTRSVGEFLYDRMRAMKFDVIIAKDVSYANEGRAVIILTVSGESLRTSSFLSNHDQDFRKLIITCVKTSGKDTISLNSYMYKERTTIDLFKSLRLMNDWIQDAIDVYCYTQKKEFF